MGALSGFRTTVFFLVPVLAVAVLALCAYIDSVIDDPAAITEDPFLSYIPLGLVAAALTIVLLPTFYFIGRAYPGNFVSTIAFDAGLTFILLILWAATAGQTIAGANVLFEGGCSAIPDPASLEYGVCIETDVIAAISFINFFLLFAFATTINIYSLRGQGLWTSSIAGSNKMGTSGTSPMGQGLPPGVFYPYPVHTGGTPANAPPHPQFPGYHSPPPMPGYPPQGYPGSVPGSPPPNMPMPYGYYPGFYPGYPPQSPQSPPAPGAPISPLLTPNQAAPGLSATPEPTSNAFAAGSEAHHHPTSS
ncbi:hypothetical protein BJ138DRAFT_569003 [Hygrophoropsis aurantiaca]|uniref:Uncharacterized protein n=1 Tax=Hygrophoropsis aurantiaca TaxID=72124 RepID=A0ACB8AJN8_9AGAM|nr:hypothetical protein BJ138DRAFT_569003 [Hygrophoropsis aurantiaca]